MVCYLIIEKFTLKVLILWAQLRQEPKRKTRNYNL